MRRLRFLSWIDCYVFVRVFVIAFFFGFTPLLLLKIFFVAPHLIRSSAIYSSTRVTLVGISKFVSYPDCHSKSVFII